MKRTDFPLPFMTALVDLNSVTAYEDRGETARKAPRLLPVPKETISADPQRLILEPWRKNLKLYPQLYFLCGRDIPVKNFDVAKGAVLGIGLGLALSDDGILLASPDPTPRDSHVCYWYSLYSDNSQVLSEELREGVKARDVVLTLESETLGKRVFDQRNLLFDPEELLKEANTLVAFRRYDLISLGAAGCPIALPADRRFRPGEVIRISSPQLGTMEITVEDRRDPAVRIPTWTPRAFYLDTEDQEDTWT